MLSTVLEAEDTVKNYKGYSLSSSKDRKIKHGKNSQGWSATLKIRIESWKETVLQMEGVILDRESSRYEDT